MLRHSGRWLSAVLLLFQTLVPPAFADAPAGGSVHADAARVSPRPASQDGQKVSQRVRKIRFSGLSRTEESVVRRELEIHEGDPLEIDRVEESVRRIRNLRIFRSVDHRIVPVPEAESGGRAEADIIISLRERWTTIMIFQPGAAGGSRYLYLGGYDPNVFGRYLELGGQYHWQDGRSSGKLWFTDPRFLGRRLEFSLTAGLDRSSLDLYSAGSGASGEARTGGFSRTTALVKARLDRELRPEWIIGSEVRVLSDRIFDIEGDAAGESEPRDGVTASLGVYTEFGRVNFEKDFLENGRATRLRLDVASDIWGSDFEFVQASIGHRSFWTGPWLSNFGLRASAGHTTADTLQNQFFLGGVGDVRGYRYSQFSGQSYWRLNAEWRVPSLVNSWIIAQHVLFADAAAVAGSPAALFRAEPFESVGLGLRIMSPRIYSLSLRLDYAIPLDARGERAWSFGVQQFF